MKKGGCVLLNKELDKVALVYREKLNDYSFPKGHKEDNENIKECAIRETIEETGRDCHLLINEPISILKYNNYEGDIEVYMYLAVDDGITNKYINDYDKETLVWTDINKVKDVLTYDNLKEFWSVAEETINEIKTI